MNTKNEAPYNSNSLITVIHDIESLPCPLTEQELYVAAAQLSRWSQRLAEKKEQLAEINASIKSEMAEINVEITSLQRKLITKSEDREVPIEIRLDRNSREAQYIRTDTGEIYRQRPLRPDEMQISMLPHDTKDTAQERDT